MKTHEMDLTTGALIPKVIKYSIPIVLAGILQLAFNAADLIVVGQFAGDGSVGAVGATGSLTSLIVNLFIGLSIGTCSTVARFVGAGDRESANRAAHTSILLALIGGIVVGVIGVMFSKTFLRLMDTPADIIDRSALYMKIYFMGAPINMLYNFGSAIMRATGDTKRPLYYLTVAGIVNVILNIVMVTIFDLDVAGVAIATVVSQFVSAFLVLRALFKTDGTCKLSLSKMKLHIRELTIIARIGIPAGVQSSLFSVSNVIIQSSINSFGSLATDGNAAAANFEGFIYTAMNAIAQAALAFVSQNAGAKKMKRVWRSSMVCTGLVCVIGIVIGSVMFIFRKELLAVYLGSENFAAIAYGEQRSNIICITYFLCGIMEIFSYSLRGLGRSTTPTVVSFIGSCLFRIVWVYTAFAAERTLPCLYLSYPLSWAITSIVLFAFFAVAYRSYSKRIANIPLYQ